MFSSSACVAAGFNLVLIFVTTGCGWFTIRDNVSNGCNTSHVCLSYSFP